MSTDLSDEGCELLCDETVFASELLAMVSVQRGLDNPVGGEETMARVKLERSLTAGGGGCGMRANLAGWWFCAYASKKVAIGGTVAASALSAVVGNARGVR